MHRGYEYRNTSYYGHESRQYEYHHLGRSFSGGIPISSIDGYFQPLVKIPKMPLMITEFPPHFPNFNDVMNINSSLEEDIANHHKKTMSRIDQYQRKNPNTNHHHHQRHYNQPPMVHKNVDDSVEHEYWTAKDGRDHEKRDVYDQNINVDMEADRFIKQKRDNFDSSNRDYYYKGY